MKRLRRLLPEPETLQRNRWLRWLGPSLFHPRLWHLSRRGLAMGMALGVFFGLLIPIAQIPFSAAAAVALRANVPAAVASTLVTNPITFGPVYYLAWQVGNAILDEEAAPPQTLPGATPPAPAASQPSSWWQEMRERVVGVGRPLLLGLALMACSVGLLTYLVVSWIWVWRVRSKRRGRLRQAPGSLSGHID